MNNTGKFFKTHKTFRDSMRDIQKREEKELSALQRFTDSGNFAAEAEKVQKRFAVEKDAARATARQGFDSALKAMQDKLNERSKKPLTPPTPEQEAILRTLRMLDTVTVEQLERAGEALAGCDVAVDVLNQIAVASGHPSHQIQTDYRAEYQRQLQALSRFARTTLEMPIVDGKAQYVQRRNLNDVHFLTHDRDFQSEDDCMGWAGDGADSNGFYDAVN